MWKINLIIVASIFCVSCAGLKGVPPKMERDIKIYNGAPEVAGICRKNRVTVASNISQELKTSIAKEAVKKTLENNIAPDTASDCVSANSADFKKYAGISFQDLGVILRYIENLTYSCERWKK